MIIPMTSETLEACVELFVDTFNRPPWNESWDANDAEQRLRDFLDTPRVHGVCLLGPEGEMAGFAIGHRERFGADDRFLLQEMCVRSSRQRQGHGSRLLQALAKDLVDVEHWYLLTARNSDASAFYETKGFRAAGRMGVFVRP